jgi:hypothetical protein
MPYSARRSSSVFEIRYTSTVTSARNGSVPTIGTWTYAFSERRNARRVQLDLVYDYRTNVDLYLQRQKFLRERHPRTLIFWGQNVIFFTPEGGETYLQGLPDAKMQRLDSRQFALEDSLDTIASNMRHFYDEKVSPASPTAASRKTAK